MVRLIPRAVLSLLLPVLCMAQATENSWDNLNWLRVGQKIEVKVTNPKSAEGQFSGFSEEAISLRAAGGRRESAPRRRFPG